MLNFGQQFPPIESHIQIFDYIDSILLICFVNRAIQCRSFLLVGKVNSFPYNTISSYENSY